MHAPSEESRKIARALKPFDAWINGRKRFQGGLRADQGRARNAMIRAAATAYTNQGHPPAHVFLAHRPASDQPTRLDA